MQKKLLPLAVAAGLAASAAQAEIEVSWGGFAQLTAEVIDEGDQDGLRFGADRVRWVSKIKDGPIYGIIQVDFTKSDEGSSTNDATFDEIIKDAFGGYKFNNAAMVQVGQFKTPLGMDFNTSGRKLDITKRGLEKWLVPERVPGAMVKGRKIGPGIGYDVFFGNPAGRSGAADIADDQVGDDYTYGGRLMWDYEKIFHIEGAYMRVDEAGQGLDPDFDDDMDVFNVAGWWKWRQLTTKAEFIYADGIKGIDDLESWTFYIHAGWQFNDMIEAVVRHYQAEIEFDDATVAGVDIDEDEDLGNTYLGVNLYLGSNRTNGRIQLNYVVTSQDEDEWADIQNFIGNSSNNATTGYTDDAFLAQYQISF